MGAKGSRCGEASGVVIGIALLALGAAACAGPAAVAPPVRPAEVVVASPDPSDAAPDGPPITFREALSRGRTLAEAWQAGPRWQEAGKRAAFLAEHHLDERTLRRLLAPIVRACLAETDEQAAACKELSDDHESAGKVTSALVGMLAEVTDPSPRVGPGLRLLVRLDARGHWEAGAGLFRMLERRMIASREASGGEPDPLPGRAQGSPARCEPPSPAEVAAARTSLADFAVVAPWPASPAAPARWPTAAELDDLAYLYAVVSGSGSEVGSVEEDLTATSLPDGHPALARSAGLRTEMTGALRDGDLHRHLRAAEAYLEILGYPGPLRIGEDRSPRWGGSGASYVMRDAAQSAEIVGRYDLAEALYRRALPGGGMCGTSVPMHRAAQIMGVIRSAEQGRGCRAIAAELLYGAGSRRESVYGPDRLTRAGFDVPRLYAAALLTLGREDADLERSLHALSTSTRGASAVGRLGRMGNEAWAVRLRAIPGYADAAQGAAVPRLLVIAEAARTEARVEALDALGALAEDFGFDPCIPTTFAAHRHTSHMNGNRTVHSVMNACPTRIDAARIGAAAVRIEALASDPEPTVREAVARTLGRLGTARSRRVLVELTRDGHDSGGQLCNLGIGGVRYCEPHRPVADAARDALERIAEADAMRARQEAARKGVPSLRRCATGGSSTSPSRSQRCLDAL